LQEKGWRECTPAGLVLEPGNAIEYETGTWRSFRPIIDMEKCTHCMFCWIFCPDGSIMVKDSKVIGVDLKHCKGCGICAQECPRKAITMIEESKAKAEATR
jgi:2-oxoacid:acceptor oxidoreductase delta subunit (pyruvate/2-ketoisovalerate family)